MKMKLEGTSLVYFFLAVFAFQFLLLCLVPYNYIGMFFADICRPVVMFAFLTQLRFSVLELYYDIKASVYIIFVLFAWIFFFALGGYFIFHYSMEGL